MENHNRDTRDPDSGRGSSMVRLFTTRASTLEHLFSEARTAYGGTLLKVADPVKKLTEGSGGN